MKQFRGIQVEVTQQVWQLTLQGEPVLTCQLTRPQLTGRGRGVRAINRYYQRVAETWKRRWDRELYLRACLDLADRTAAGKSFQPWQAQVDTCVTLDNGELLSLWQEGRERQGNRPAFVVRTGDSWHVQTGAPVVLKELFRGVMNWRKHVLVQLEQQVRQRLEQGESLLFQHCTDLAKAQFDPKRFWLEEDGLRIFYLPEVLGSRVEGTIVFAISIPVRE